MINEIWIVLALNKTLLDIWLGNSSSARLVNSTKPGFFFKKQDAIDAVLANANDLCEAGMNQYAVVYPIKEGLDMYCSEKDRQHWFEYDLKTDTFKEIACINTGDVVLDF